MRLRASWKAWWETEEAIDDRTTADGTPPPGNSVSVRLHVPPLGRDVHRLGHGGSLPIVSTSGGADPGPVRKPRAQLSADGELQLSGSPHPGGAGAAGPRPAVRIPNAPGRTLEPGAALTLGAGAGRPAGAASAAAGHAAGPGWRSR